MSSVVRPLRALKRLTGFAGQLVRDAAWHRRYRGDTFPPLATRMVEQARLLYRSAIDAEDYYNHGLFRPELSFERKAEFLGHFEKTRYFDTINPPLYDLLARDKALFHLVAEPLGVPTPQVLATTGQRSAPAVGERLQDEGALRDWLLQPGREDLFLKPVDGSLGEGAMSLGARIAGQPAWQRLPDGEPITLDEVLRSVRGRDGLDRYLIQRRLHPHPAMAAIVPGVCPSLRLMTCIVDGRARFAGVALRLGSGAGPTDNLSGGGVAVAIDYATGTLGSAVAIENGVPVRGSAHPRTGQRITGVVLPYWQDIKHLSLHWAQQCAFLPCIGWDVGITDHGPVIIEINSRPRCRPVQIANDRGILAGELGRALAPHNGLLASGLHVRPAAQPALPTTA